MKKQLTYFKLLLLWFFWGATMDIIAEYIISRPANGYLQTLTVFGGIVFTSLLVRYTYNDFTNLKNKLND
jgi:hypothetical protein